jgi:hypothetical protein
MVLMIDSSDHITGKTGLTLTITLSKNGGAFSSISPTVTERGNGWYNIALTSAHTDTLGDLALHVSAAGADPTDRFDDVVDRPKDLLDYADAVEASLTLRQAVRLISAVLAGDAVVSGNNIIFRNALADTKNRIVVTVDESGNRTFTTIDPT